MTDRTKTAENEVESRGMSPPRWMTRVEKADYRRIVDARKVVGNPVLATEHDLIVDYVTCRSRITALRQLTKLALDECVKKDSWGRRRGCIPPDQRHAASMVRALDASSTLARRIARELKLNTNA